MRALIDADVIAFVEALAANDTDYFSDGFIVLDIEKAADRASAVIEDWMSILDADDVVLAFSDPDRRNFRKAYLDIGYKENRSGEKPNGYNELVSALQARFPWTDLPYLEGDDVLGIMHTSPEVKEDTVVVSIDKDMNTVPGLLFNPSKMPRAMEITPEEATWYWMYQTLVGDPVDGYKGCPRIGKAKAPRLLPDPTRWRSGHDAFIQECWTSVMHAYRSAYPSYPESTIERSALQQARAARILHSSDYKDGSIRLWHPVPDKAQWVNPHTNPEL